MFCSIVLGFFVGALAFKALRHAMYFHGGGCGGYRHGYRGGPPWGPGYGRGYGPGYGPGYGAGCGSGYGHRRHGPGWGPGWGFHGHPGAYGGEDPRGFDGEPGFDGSQAVRARVKNVSLDEATRGLELHERQRAEAEPVVNRLKEWLGSRGPRISAVLTVLSQERFDGEALGPILGDLPPAERRELFEGLEHLHTILIPEQRESLRRALGLSQAPSGQSTPSV